MTTAECIAERLEGVFRGIHESRMHGLPILNPALRVQAVGFRAHEDHWLGVLVTPWSINLMRLPQNPARDGRPAPGSIRTLSFPAGDFDFIAGEEPGIGCYEICSLYSPASEFADHDAALTTARAIINLLFDERTAAIDNAAIEAPGFRTPRGLTRRELLRGRLRDSAR